MADNNLRERYQEVYNWIDKIKFLFSLGQDIDESKVDELFNGLFEADKCTFGGMYDTAEKMTVLFDMLNVIADNHIRRRDTESLFGYMIQWAETFKGFVSHPQFSEVEKLPVKQSFQELHRKVRAYMEYEAKGEDVVGLERESRNRKNVRDANCKCLLCRQRAADKVGSHMVPNMLIERLFAFDGKKGRDYEIVERHTMADDERYAYVGRNISQDDRERILGRPLRLDEVENAKEDHNPLTFDYYFCRECEKRLAEIEKWYGEIIQHPSREYPPVIPYLFWMSVTWRMSIVKMGIILDAGHEEKYRKILDQSLSCNRDEIITDYRKLGHCAYTLHRAVDTKGEGLGIMGIPVPIVPALYIIGNNVVRFYHSLDRARKVTKRMGLSENIINAGRAAEVVSDYTFLEFWKDKRFILDQNWDFDYFGKIGNGTGVSQFIVQRDYEKEHLNDTGQLINIMHGLQEAEGYALTMPYAVKRITDFITTHTPGNKEELFAATGYTEEEVSEIMSYWLAKSESDLDRQE